jgi:ATP-dependent DNA helicase PIF1
LLPGELDIIIVRPSITTAAGGEPRVQQQFRKDTRVRRSAVRNWLKYLWVNHPGYEHIDISEERLSQLPEDAEVEDNLIVQEEADGAQEEGDKAADSDDDEAEVGDDKPEVATVPDFVAKTDEIDQIRRQFHGDPAEGEETIGRQPGRYDILTALDVQSTPLSEFDRGQPLLSLAFPTLFPNGAAEYTTPCQRGIAFPQFVKHLFLHKSGRFQQHPRFRYAVFNLMTRHQINEKAGFFVKKLRPEDKDISIDDLCRAFLDDTPDSRAILNSVTRYSGSLRGTRPYWNGQRHGLTSMVRQLDCPDLFVTLSAADYHWHSLLKHIDSHLDYIQEAD